MLQYCSNVNLMFLFYFGVFMQELNMIEVDAVGGGIWAFVAGVIGGFVGNYLYESAGGKKGIDDALNRFQPDYSAYDGFGSLG